MTTTNIALAAIAVICVAGVAYFIVQSNRGTFNSDESNAATSWALVFTMILMADAIVAIIYNTWISFFN